MRDKKINRIKKEHKLIDMLDKCSIAAYTFIYPCEDQDKVVKTINNVLNGKLRIEVIDKGKKIKKVSIVAKGKEPIFKIFNQFRSRQVLATVRKHLIKYSKDNKIVMYLHKQAAYVGTYSICDVGESPLGEIIVEIKVEDPREIIYWLTRF